VSVYPFPGPLHHHQQHSLIEIETWSWRPRRHWHLVRRCPPGPQLERPRSSAVPCPIHSLSCWTGGSPPTARTWSRYDAISTPTLNYRVKSTEQPSTSLLD